MFNRKKLMLSLGSITAVVAPVATVVSCGIEEPTREDIKNKFLLESQAVMDRVQEQWWSEVLTEQTGATSPLDATKLFDVQEVKDAFDFIIRGHVTHDKKFLITLTSSLMSTSAMQQKATAAGKSVYQLAQSWNLLEYRVNGDMTNNPLSPDAKEFIFKNSRTIRHETLKMTISYLFLNNKMTKDDWMNVYDKKATDLSDIQKTIDADDFLLINEAIDQHLFAQWNVNLTKAETLSFIGVTPDKLPKADVDTKIKKGGDVYNAIKAYSSKNTNLLNGLMPGSYADFPAFAGIASKKGKRGIMNLDFSGLKLATTKDKWDGYMKNDDIVSTDIPYFPDKSNLVKFNKVVGLMPIYKSNKFTFDTTDYGNAAGRKQLAMLLSRKTSVYSMAEKYFTTRKLPHHTPPLSPLLLEIKSEILKQIAIEHGFEFIKQ